VDIDFRLPAVPADEKSFGLEVDSLSEQAVELLLGTIDDPDPATSPEAFQAAAALAEDVRIRDRYKAVVLHYAHRGSSRTSSIDGYRAAELREAASKTSGNVEPLQHQVMLETAQVLTALAGVGCDVAQGHHLARPMPVDAFDTGRRSSPPACPGPRPAPRRPASGTSPPPPGSPSPWSATTCRSCTGPPWSPAPSAGATSTTKPTSQRSPTYPSRRRSVTAAPATAESPSPPSCQ
jgi:hypothetical protein